MKPFTVFKAKHWTKLSSYFTFISGKGRGRYKGSLKNAYWFVIHITTLALAGAALHIRFQYH